ncbi:MAG TPA: EamA family transporter [Rhabdochlamydiaceae bacterium]|nr:EamA family transporter [Rhabdochlamydiaceae bacterium]
MRSANPRALVRSKFKVSTRWEYALGLRYGSPKALAPLCYTSVVFAMVYDWTIWKDIPSLAAFIGIILVIVGGIIALLIENRSTRVSEADFK